MSEVGVRCPNCASADVMFSKKRQVYVCEDCGHEFTVETPFVPKRVFISYGHDEHIALAVKLRDDLKAQGHLPWFDGDRLPPGQDWERNIEEGLAWAAADKANGAVALLMTPHSVRRPEGYCLNEVARALGLGLRVIPMMVVDSEPPLSICRIQWLDLRPCIPISEKGALYQPRFERFLEALTNPALDFEGNQQRLLKALQPLDFDADILFHLKSFVGREWVFRKIDAWLKQPDAQRVFWITGLPGVGKTAICAWLSSRYIEIGAMHLCKFGHRQKGHPAKVVASLVYQLATQLPEYEAALLAKDIGTLALDDARTMFDNLIVQPLSKLSKPDRPVALLIDALDEATHDGQNALAGFIAAEFPKTPDWLRLIITSRPEPEVTGPLQRLTPFVLDTACQDNINDIRDYIEQQLKEKLLGRADANTIVQTILDRSEYVFLYVQRVCQDVLDGALSLDAMDQFPKGLGEAFWQFFERQFGNTDDDKTRLDRYKERTRPALRAILAAREPLPVAVLQSLFQWSDEELNDFTIALGSLFPVSGSEGAETIKPYHKAIADWLADKTRSGAYFVSIEEGEKLLAERGWREYRDKGPDNMPLYFLRHLPAHLIETKRWDTLIGDAGTPGVLTDLLFIPAKCRAGLVHELVTDYNATLAALPEFLEENELRRRRSEAMIAYNKALRDYAVRRANWRDRKEPGEFVPEPEYPVMPLELQDKQETSIPEEASERAVRLRHFANFVAGHLAFLRYCPENTLPLAMNWAEGGPVGETAERQIRNSNFCCLQSLICPPIPPDRPQCLRILEGHSARVWCVCVTSDGTRAISGSSDRTVRLWDLETGACLLILQEPSRTVNSVDTIPDIQKRSPRSLNYNSRTVNSVDTIPDGTLAVSGNVDSRVSLWDLETGKCVRKFLGHTAAVNSVRIAPNGKHMISGSQDYTVRLWDVETGKCFRTLRGHTKNVNSVCFTPDGTRAISGSYDKTIRLWDLKTGKCLCILRGHTDWVTSVCVMPDGVRAISGGWDRTVRLWNLETGVCLRTIENLPDSIWSVCVTPDGMRVISGTLDNTIQLWNLQTGVCLRTLQGHNDSVTSVCISPDGTRAISGSYDKTLRLWDLETGACLRMRLGHTSAVESVCIMPNGLRVLSGSSDNTVRLWDLQSGLCLSILQGHTSRVLSVCATPDGTRAISGSSDKNMHIWNIEKGTSLCILKGHTSVVNSVCITPDSKRVISGSSDKTLRMWDLETCVCMQILQGHNHNISRVSVTPDGMFAISSSVDKTVRLWNLETGDCLRTLQGHSDWVLSVCVTPDGRRAISGSRDRNMCLWDLETGTCLCAFQGHRSTVEVVCVASDGTRAISGSLDNTLRLWDLETGACLHIFKEHDEPVRSVAFCPSGWYAASGGLDKTVRLWDLETGACLAVYHAGAAVCSVSFSPQGNYIVCGTSDGQMHFLRPINIPYGPPVVTAVQLWNFGDVQKNGDILISTPGQRADHLTIVCPCCGQRVPVRYDHLGQQITCPLDGCGGEMQLNPFVAGEREF